MGTFGRYRACMALTAALLTSTWLSVPALAADDMIEQLESRGTIRVCLAEDNPWQFKDPSTGEWSGLVKEMIVQFAADLELKLEEVNSSWKTAIQSLNTGECDIVGANLFGSVKRSKLILFSDPWAYETSTAYVKADSSYKSFAELDQPGKTIVTKAGTATHDFAARFFKQATVKPLPNDTDVVLLGEVASGRADAFWNSSSKAGPLLDANPQFGVRAIGEEPTDKIPMIWGIGKGQYAFQQLVNVWVNQYISSGKMAEAWEKWFKTEYVGD